MSDTDSRWRSYFYPATDTLVNIPGIRDPKTLSTFEASATIARALELKEQPIKPTFTVEHLTAIHRHLFQDVFPWAGKMRTVEIEKGASAFTPVIAPNGLDLTAQGKVLMNDLAADKHLVGLRKELFVTRLAHHMEALNYWHPFREGNGRTMRIFFSQLAEGAGYALDFSRTNSREWSRAAEAATAQYNQIPLRSILREVVTPHIARAFAKAHRTQNYADALKRHPDLEGAIGTIQLLRNHIREHSSEERYEQQIHKLNIVAAKLQKRLHEGQIPENQGPEKALGLLRDLSPSRSN